MPPERDPQAEIEQLEQRVAENPEGRMFAHLADAYRKAGELDQAERIILDGLERHPDYVSAHLVLGRVYMDGGRADEAGRQFQRTLDLDPHNLIALKALGDLSVQKGAAEEARSWYERMLQVDPYNDEAQAALEGLGGGPHGTEPPVSMEELAIDEPTAPSQGDVLEPDTTDLPPEAQEAAPDIGSEIEAGEPEAVEGLEPTDRPDGFVSEERPAQPSDADLPEAPDTGSEASTIDQVRDQPRPRSEGPDEPGAGELDIDFDEMDAWSPGLVQEEDFAGERMDDEELLGVSEGEEEEEDDVVTETMAELYLDQGLHREALEVYRQLGDVRPHDERIRARIRELEERLESESGGGQEATADLEEGWEMPAETGGEAGLEDAATEAEYEEPATEAEYEEPAAEGELEEGDALGIEPADVEELFASAAGSVEEEREPPAEPEFESARSGMDMEGEEPSMPSDPPGHEFEFEVGAPTAGDLKEIDPFAASFADPEPATGPSLFDEEVATPSEEEVAPPPDEEVATPSEQQVATPSAETAPGEPALDEEREPSEREAAREAGEMAAFGSEAGDISDVEPGSAEAEPVEREEPAAAVPRRRGPEVAEEGVPSVSRRQESIRTYLQRLLHGTAGVNGSAEDAAGASSGNRDASEPGGPNEGDADPGTSAERSDEPEDLAQFQEWLRSLKR